MVANPPTNIREEGLTVEPGAAGLPSAGAPIRQSNLWKDAWRRYIRNRGALVAAVFFGLIVLYCLIVPIISPHDPNEVNFAHREPDARASRTRSAPTSSAATSSRAPRSAVASRSRSPSARRWRFSSSASSTARSRASSAAGSTTAMMRFLDALYGLPYLPVRDHHARDHRHDEHLDDGDRAVDRELVHDGTDRARPGDHAEGERLRARGEGGGCALVPGARPPSAAEHARRAHHRDLPRAPGRHPGRGVPVLHRSRHQPAGRVVGCDGARRPHASTARIRPRSSSRRSRSPRSSSAPTSSRTASATPSTRGRGRPSLALLEVHDLRTHFFTREGAVRAVDGIDFTVDVGKTLGIVGESGSGKSVTALSIMGLIPKPPAEIVSGSVIYDGQDLTKLSEKKLEDIRGTRDRDDLPGSDDVAEPDADDRHADHRDDPPPSTTSRRRRRARRRSSCSRRCGSRAPPSGSTTTRTASRAACGSA